MTDYISMDAEAFQKVLDNCHSVEEVNQVLGDLSNETKVTPPLPKPCTIYGLRQWKYENDQRFKSVNDKMDMAAKRVITILTQRHS